jgi:hypothetical protein
MAVVWAWAGLQLVAVLSAGSLAATVPFATGVGQPHTAGMVFAATAGLSVVGAALRIAYIWMITAGQHERIGPALAGPRRTRDLPPGALAPVRTDRPPSYG